MLARMLFSLLMFTGKITLLYFSDVLGIVLFVNDVRTVNGDFCQQWFFISWINSNLCFHFYSRETVLINP